MVPRDDSMMLAKAIKAANKTCCYGVGHEGLIMRSFATNLHHMGFECYCIGDINLPKFEKDDLVLVSAGPSLYNSVTSSSQLFLYIYDFLFKF